MTGNMNRSNEISHNIIGPGARIIQGDVNASYHYNDDASKPRHRIPLHRNEDVVSRNEILAKLEILLPWSKRTEFYSAALWGLGGSGKTQIALDYAYRRSIDPTCSVFWVNADNDGTFMADYKDIAGQFGLAEDLQGTGLLKAVCERIQLQAHWLLVLDNADDLTYFGINGASQQLDLNRFIPSGPRGTVLWTSRDSNVAGTVVGSQRGVEVSQMTLDEAKALLGTTRNKRIEDEELSDATKLFEQLYYLPLAISQAGAYLQKTTTTLEEYLSKLAEEKERWRVLKLVIEGTRNRHQPDRVPHHILETWNISMDRIRKENDMAFKIMHTIAYLDNENIPVGLLSTAASYHHSRKRGKTTEEPAEQVEKAITRLVEFSFLRRRNDGDKKSFEMHKLVQEAARYRLYVAKLLRGIRKRFRLRLSRIMRCLRTDDEEEYFYTTALRTMCELFPEAEMNSTMERCKQYIAHALRVSDWQDYCGNEVKAADLLTKASQYIYFTGNSRRELMLDEKIVQLQQSVLGEKHSSTLISMQRLSTTYQRQGRYKDTEDLLNKLLSLNKKVRGDDHEETLESLAALSRIYQLQARYEEAEEVQTVVLGKRERILGKDHRDTLESMEDIASNYYSQARYKEAESIQATVLEQRQKQFGDKHVDTVAAMIDIGKTFYSLEKYDDAEKMHLRVQEIATELECEEHPTFRPNMGHLAKIHVLKGQYDEAKELYVRGIKLEREGNGDANPDIYNNAFDLCCLLDKQGRYDEAIGLVREWLEFSSQNMDSGNKKTKDFNILLQKLTEEASERKRRGEDTGEGSKGEEIVESSIVAAHEDS
ncbi:Nephrocystin-3-like protein [Cladobotryum mycophilum]|uniref:Nephrocystin-3-like protein n=1 Tax=Cladobotryum mycophilum TaxID=491253 RepID=A0ABR0SPJ3_9HYPO